MEQNTSDIRPIINKPTKQRDKTLDIYRGCSMIYITCFLHNIYGVQVIDTVVTSLFLITMPIVFIIAGASFSLASPKTYPDYLWSRTKRIVFPYYILVMFVTLYHLITDCIVGNETIGEFIHQFIDNGYYNIFSGELYEFNPVWFIPVYLLIAIILPLFGYIKQHITKAGIYTALIIITVLLAFIPDNMLCYGTFAFAGLYYKDKLPVNRYIVAFIFACGIGYCLWQNYDLNMQHNKFPPNILFFSYTGLIIALFIKQIAWLCRRIYQIPFLRYFIDIYARLGLTVYLYHSINVLILRQILYRIASTYSISAIGNICLLILTSIILLIGNAYLSIFMKKAETCLIDWGAKTWNKSKHFFIRTEQ